MLTDAPSAQEWLEQFEPDDREAAQELLDAIVTVTHDSFADKLRQLVISRTFGGGKVGLYAERELPHDSVLFSQPDRRPRRAFGTGPAPVVANARQEVGSEGIVANIITDLFREQPRQCESHPGPDRIRDAKIRKFVLLTDFIGSGNQVRRYLDAAWRVCSVRSWASWGLIEFHVVAYSGTTFGIRAVEKAACRAKVHVVASCPTIGDFPRQKKKRMTDLCRKYGSSSTSPLGYESIGALIAFAHGAPNNCPAIVVGQSGGWKALFPNRRRTTEARPYFAKGHSIEQTKSRLRLMGESRIAKSPVVVSASEEARNRIVIMAALAHGPRYIYAISNKTGLTLEEIDIQLHVMTSLGWIDEHRHLTDYGRRELRKARQARRSTSRNERLPETTTSWYCPQTLRAPG